MQRLDELGILDLLATLGLVLAEQDVAVRAGPGLVNQIGVCGASESNIALSKYEDRTDVCQMQGGQ